jgi:toxin-antitoxin system PIN domain toxin
VIAVDTNVLVYSHRKEATEYAAAKSKLNELASSSHPWAIPWQCLYEFFGVVTNRRIWKDSASTQAQAWQQIEQWTSSPSVTLLAETEDFLEVLAKLMLRPRVVGPAVHDARVAAVCLAHGVETLLTRDRDFSLFPELKTENPF